MGVDAPTPLHWGIIGCGRIANDFVNALKGMPEESATLTACASRSLESSDKFAKTHGIARAYGSYQELCADSEVDVVYISTIHLVHFEQITLALHYGKHVLVEKSMTMNAKEAAAAIDLAKAKNLFLMEGVWTRCFPSIKYVRQLLAEGKLGDVHHVHSNLGVPYVNSDNLDMQSTKSGHGALLRIGIYPLSFITMVFGTKPLKVSATGKTSPGGADLYGSATLEFEGNKFGSIDYSSMADIGNSVTITGTKGSIYLPDPAHCANQVIFTEFLENGTKRETKMHFPWPTPLPKIATMFNYNGSQAFLFEAEAVTKAIRSGQQECAEYPQAESLGIAAIMDEIRRSIGVVYAADSA